MLHPADTQDQQPARTNACTNSGPDQHPGPVANPRRTRLGADGRPVDGAADTRRD